MRARYMLAIGLALSPAAAFASETVTYSYDAKGRLTQVAHSGGREDGVKSTYQFDAADNRASVTVTGAWLDDGAHQVVVTPLPGMPILIIPNN